jgi:hypothetical protein
LSRVYRPRAKVKIYVPDWEATADNVEYLEIEPPVVELKWTKNNHLEADEMTVTIPYMYGGVDPRLLKQAVIEMWLWDEERALIPNDEEHLRFAGLVTKAHRKMGHDEMHVELECKDYTIIFLDMKPYHQSGIPEWSDTYRTAWAKLCDNTGYWDREAQKIRSSCRKLRNSIEFQPPEIESYTLLEGATERFHAISKPTPRVGSDAWGVWQWLTGMRGLVSYIDRGRCIVSTTNEHFVEKDAPIFNYGDNMDDLQDTADTYVSNNGVLLKSYNPLTNTMLESAYPPPEDQRIKKTRAVVRRADKEGRDVGLNEVSAHYIEQSVPFITDQLELDRYAKAVYEVWSKQEVKGSFHTKEMFVMAGQHRDIEVDVLDLMPGDCIYIGVHQEAFDHIQHLEKEVDKVAYLYETLGLDPFMAQIIVRNRDVALANPVFHVESLEVSLNGNDATFDIDIRFHNKVRLNTPNGAT